MAQGFTGTTISSLVDNKVVDGRLTLATATPVTTTDQLAKTTVYFTPYKGNRIALYDGSAWQMITFSEVSVAVPATTTTPFDIWGVLSGGALTLETTNWTNDTTRATALALQDGVQSKSGSLTRRYLGTGRTTGVSGQTEDSYKGNHQSGGRRFLWNYYNRVLRNMAVIDTTDSWTYTTATWRASNGQTTLNLVECVIGWSEDIVTATAHSQVYNPAALTLGNGVGIDATNANSAKTYGVAISAGIAVTFEAKYTGFLSVGYHYIAWLEYSQVINTTTWYGDNGLPGNLQSGLQAEIWG